MANPQSPITPTDYDAFPSLTRAATAPIGLVGGPRPDRSRLAPEDAFYAQSPPRSGTGLSGPPPTAASASNSNSNGNSNSNSVGAAAALGLELRSRRVRAALGGEASRSRSRRRKRMWKKLLWVKQSYPDNYTDRATFLENLQRNPRPPFYDFWPLVADSTVIVQHVCSVIIFIVCFVGIFQERVSPLTVVSCSTLATFLGWLLWERWVADEEGSVGEDEAGRDSLGLAPGHHGGGAGAAPGLGRSGSLRRAGGGSIRRPPPRIRRDDLSGVGNVSTAASAASSTSNLSIGGGGGGGGGELRPHRHVYSTSTSSLLSQSSTHGSLPAQTGASSAPKSSSEESLPSSLRGAAAPAAPATDSTPDADDGDTRTGDDIGRSPQRLGTIKSAILIYSTLLSLSPILKSLTRSTSSDSIWSMSFWLLTINIFFFDYSGGVVGVRFPASLSTNAALMASTVLASRLPSTGQVFSLTLFSIEVFGLFPVFRRYSRHRSWQWHVLLTVLLVLGAGCGVGMILGDSNGLPWRSGLVGMAVGALIAVVAMGGCSWWLIGLQKYKNEISGPWDPARPIIISRRHWDDG